MSDLVVVAWMGVQAGAAAAGVPQLGRSELRGGVGARARGRPRVLPLHQRAYDLG